MYKFFFLLLFLFPQLIFSETHKCDSLETESKKLSCYKKEWESVDKKLNKTYQSLKNKLPKNEAEEMKLDSRQWIAKKESYCTDVRYTGDPDAEKKNSSYYSCLLSFTSSRLEFLKKGFGKENISKKFEGSYSDGDGGWMEIKKTKNGYQFQISCSRGPTSHTGEITGTIRKPQKSFKWKESLSDGECDLDFEISDYTITVTEQECSNFHGANGYFSGKYRKMKD
jgi:uncharacterized protein YecT (DUF1311 family)